MSLRPFPILAAVVSLALLTSPARAQVCDDTDADGVCDDVDTCALVADPQQLDADQDGAGDACDVCASPGDGASLFGPANPMSLLFYPPDALEVTDLDGDGANDVLVGTQDHAQNGWDFANVDWFRRLANGTFVYRDTLHEGVLATNLSDVHTADLDGDGDRDLLLAEDHVYQIENLGGGRFGASTLVGVQAEPTAIATADLDRDGALDVIVASATQDEVVVFRNLGNLTFAPKVVLDSGHGAPKSVGVGDLDGDRDVDVVVGWSATGTVTWSENQGGGVFAPPQVVTTEDTGVERVLVGRLSAGDDPDIVTAGAHGVAHHFNQGSFGFDRLLLSSSMGAARDVTAGDQDADGDLDLVALSAADGSAWWFERTWSAYFHPEVPLVEGTGATALASGRLDGDRDADLVIGGATYESLAECALLDTDNDGLHDADELLSVGTDPTIADSDGGGADDGLELDLGDDPFDPADDIAPAISLPSPGRAGRLNTIVVTGATPGSDVDLVVGRFEGADPVPVWRCEQFVSGLAGQIIIAAGGVADASGVATIDLRIPESHAGETWYYQAVDIATCAGTPVRGAEL